MLYIIIEGYYTKDEDDNLTEIEFEDCIGVVDSVEKAYGIAYLTLSNAIKDNDQEGEIVTINPPTFVEDNESEYLITTSSNQKRIQDFVKIFALPDDRVNDRVHRNTSRWG